MVQKTKEQIKEMVKEIIGINKHIKILDIKTHFFITIYANRKGKFKNFFGSSIIEDMLKNKFKLNSVSYSRNEGLQTIFLIKKEVE